MSLVSWCHSTLTSVPGSHTGAQGARSRCVLRSGFQHYQATWGRSLTIKECQGLSKCWSYSLYPLSGQSRAIFIKLHHKLLPLSVRLCQQHKKTQFCLNQLHSNYGGMLGKQSSGTSRNEVNTNIHKRNEFWARFLLLPTAFHPQRASRALQARPVQRKARPQMQGEPLKLFPRSTTAPKSWPYSGTDNVPVRRRWVQKAAQPCQPQQVKFCPSRWRFRCSQWTLLVNTQGL